MRPAVRMMIGRSAEDGVGHSDGARGRRHPDAGSRPREGAESRLRVLGVVLRLEDDWFLVDAFFDQKAAEEEDMGGGRGFGLHDTYELRQAIDDCGCADQFTRLGWYGQRECKAPGS